MYESKASRKRLDAKEIALAVSKDMAVHGTLHRTNLDLMSEDYALVTKPYTKVYHSKMTNNYLTEKQRNVQAANRYHTLFRLPNQKRRAAYLQRLSDARHVPPAAGPAAGGGSGSGDDDNDDDKRPGADGRRGNDALPPEDVHQVEMAENKNNLLDDKRLPAAAEEMYLSESLDDKDDASTSDVSPGRNPPRSNSGSITDLSPTRSKEEIRSRSHKAPPVMWTKRLKQPHQRDKIGRVLFNSFATKL